jgi:hypothetical protein
MRLRSATDKLLPLPKRVTAVTVLVTTPDPLRFIALLSPVIPAAVPGLTITDPDMLMVLLDRTLIPDVALSCAPCSTLTITFVEPDCAATPELMVPLQVTVVPLVGA